MAPGTPIVDIVNVVASAEFENAADLEKIMEEVPQAEYDPARFPGLVLRVEHPRASVLIFKSGKMISTGTKSAEQSVRVIHSVASRLASRGIDLGPTAGAAVQNVVASVNLKGAVDLLGCARTLPGCVYEPEQFPAVIYRGGPSGVMLVFSTGRTVCTGCKTQEDVLAAVASLRQMLERGSLISYR